MPQARAIGATVDMGWITAGDEEVVATTAGVRYHRHTDDPTLLRQVGPTIDQVVTAVAGTSTVTKWSLNGQLDQRRAKSMFALPSRSFPFAVSRSGVASQNGINSVLRSFAERKATICCERRCWARRRDLPHTSG